MNRCNKEITDNNSVCKWNENMQQQFREQILADCDWQMLYHCQSEIFL